MFKITKDFTDIHYGHRVWTQKLRSELCASGDTQCACRHLHGHSGSASLTVVSKDLNPQGMVCDFKELGFMKDFLNEYFDHRFILDINDPMFSKLTLIPTNDMSNTQYFHEVIVKGVSVGWEVSSNVLDELVDDDLPQREVLEGFFFVDFIPTSERIVEYLFKMADAILSPYEIYVFSAKWKETEKSEAVYLADLTKIKEKIS